MGNYCFFFYISNILAQRKGLDFSSSFHWHKPFFQVNEGEPAVIWLSGLHIPESYLTALVQATCRKNGWPLDRSTLYTTVTKYKTAEEVTERAHAGCFVSGLYLEGASWDLEAGCLRRPKPKVLVEELPVLKVIPIEAHRLKLQVSWTLVYNGITTLYNSV